MIGNEIFSIRSAEFNPFREYTPFRFYMEKYMVPPGVHYQHNQCYWMLALIEKSEQGNIYIIYSLN